MIQKGKEGQRRVKEGLKKMHRSSGRAGHQEHARTFTDGARIWTPFSNPSCPFSHPSSPFSPFQGFS